jgi:phosphoribosylformimino-5-aminoimidazole carboxamide ribotide isomerase
MIIYPAIDLRGGQVVRLKEGDPSQQITFSADPLHTAQRWLEQGAAWLHMVNLDGAFADSNDNSRILKAVARLPVKVQFGGGLRQLSDLEHAFECGAARVVVGTLAVQQPELVAQLVERWGAESICVALDARDGKVTTHGWQQTTDLTPIALGKQLVDWGVRHVLFTDVTRDGLLGGVNLEATINLARETGLQVIASGGVQSLDDVRRLKQSDSVAGVVIGMALYQGQIRLAEALPIAGDQDAG